MKVNYFSFFQYIKIKVLTPYFSGIKISETPNDGGGDSNESRPINGELGFELADLDNPPADCINLDHEMDEGNV